MSEVTSEEQKRSSRTNTGDQTPNFQLTGLAASRKNSNGMDLQLMPMLGAGLSEKKRLGLSAQTKRRKMTDFELLAPNKCEIAVKPLGAPRQRASSQNLSSEQVALTGVTKPS